MSETLLPEGSEIDPETGWNRLMVQRMAESIRIAHEINPRSWAIHTWNRQPVLSVGFVTVASAGPATPYGLIISSKDLELNQLEMVERYKTPRSYNERPWANYLSIPAAECDSILAALQDSHDATVRILAREVKSIAHRWREHREDFRAQIERIVGRPLPHPAYDARDASSSTQESALQSPRYWKISPGPGAEEWAHFTRLSVAAMSWSDAPIDVSLLSKDRSSFVKELRNETALSVAGANSLWDFAREMQVGDHIIAYGKGVVLGYGEVTGEYQSVEDDFAFSHRRAVDWKHYTPREPMTYPDELQKKLSRRATFFELSKAEFGEAIGLGAGASHPPEDVQSLGSVLRCLQRNFALSGLHYTDSQIATFYTALQTKGFVVLSGISGTGKSKIAQGFVGMLPSSTTRTNPDPVREGLLSFTTSPVENWAAIPASLAEHFPPVPKDVQQRLAFQFNGNEYVGTAILRVLANGKPTLYVSLGTTLSNLLRRENTKQRVYAITEMDENGETLRRFRLALDPASLMSGEDHDANVVQVPNHLFLSVRPDWRDSTSLLGYYNPLTQTYEWTDFLRFLLRAVESYKAKDGLAWFVILDEMNLAHVEYYFADLLSVIESGRDDDGMSREPLRIQFPETLIDNAPPSEVRLPPNLSIIGTVNMDETTHAFSPKVLDRAFTIELSDVDFSGYPGLSATAGSTISDAEKARLLASFTRNGTFARIDKQEIAQVVEAHPEIRDWLETLNRLLRRNRFHFGYRVFDEIAQFVANADENGMLTIEDAFDHAVLMKVLPKFTGSRARLHAPLLSVLAWAVSPEAPNPAETSTRLDHALDGSIPDYEALTTDATFPWVAARAMQMMETLHLDGFVSFG